MNQAAAEAGFRHRLGRAIERDSFLYPVDGEGLMVLSFDDERTRWFRGDGWHEPERVFSWTAGYRSTLLLPAPDVAEDCLLTLQILPAFHPVWFPAQRAIISVNGFVLGERLVSGGYRQTMTVTVPRAAIADKAALVVTLDCPDAIRPVDHDPTSADDRWLAFAVFELRLRPLTRAYLARRDAVLRGIDQPLARSALEGSDTELRTTPFESFGENCEFGFVQRAAGDEPVGLLRFNGIPLHRLITGLRTGFARLGEPASLHFVTYGDELLGRESFYRMEFHTGRRVDISRMDRLPVEEGARLKFLGRKLIEDLAQGEKVFVFKSDTPVPVDDILDLQAAMRLYGDPMLLWVDKATDGHPAGTVDLIAPALMKGYIGRFADLSIGPATIDVECWLAVLRNAHALLPHAGAGRAHG